jgi:hypothetical protein
MSPSRLPPLTPVLWSSRRVPRAVASCLQHQKGARKFPPPVSAPPREGLANASEAVLSSAGNVPSGTARQWPAPCRRCRGAASSTALPTKSVHIVRLPRHNCCWLRRLSSSERRTGKRKRLVGGWRQGGPRQKADISASVAPWQSSGRRHRRRYPSRHLGPRASGPSSQLSTQWRRKTKAIIEVIHFDGTTVPSPTARKFHLRENSVSARKNGRGSLTL